MADNTSLAIRCLNIIHPIVLPDSNVVTDQLSAMLKMEEVRRGEAGGRSTSSSSTNSISNSSTITRRSKTTSVVSFSDCDEPIFRLQRDTKGCNDCILEQEIRNSATNLAVPRNGDGGRPLSEKFSSLSIHSMKANDNSTNISTASTASTTTANTSSSGSSSFDEVTLGPGMNNPSNNDNNDNNKKSSNETQERKEQHYHGRDSTSEEREKNALYRLRMSEWAYRIIDHFGASRENVALSFEYLDRFYASGLYTCNSSLDYKLASITALYIALKVHNRTTIKASTLSSLSRGEISVSDIIAMESLMLDTLSYHLCPPTCYTFISLFYAFVPASVRERVGHPLMQHAIYLTELSVMDISFQSLKASHIALAAMLNVMEVMGEEAVPSWARSRFVRDVEECMLKTSLQQQEGNDNEFATAGGCAAYTTKDRNGEGSDEEGTSTLMFHQYAEEESLFIKSLWQSVHSIEEKLWDLLSRNNFLDRENMFFFYARAPFRSIGSNSADSALEGRDDAPTSRT